LDYAAWNTLHDGSIEQIDGAVPGDVHVRIGIAYLCEKLPTAASHVVVPSEGDHEDLERRSRHGRITD
jgi:hypothetical protein